MRRMSLAGQRRLFGFGLLGIAGFTIYWYLFSTGIPVIWGPSASASEMAAGRELFEHEWTANDPLANGDGLGPVFNAKSCVACHFQGGVGGGGEVGHNATHFEILPQPGRNEYVTGVLHDFSVNASEQESMATLKARYPVIKFPPPPPPPPGHCGYIPTQKPDVDPIRTLSVQTTAMFGIGWIDRISTRAILHNYRGRAFRANISEMKMDFDTIPTGRVSFLADGRIGRFGWKANFATLEEFVAAACANELGLGTPTSAQAEPLKQTANHDVPPDLNKKQFASLMAFCDTLPRPVEIVPSTSSGEQLAKHGKTLFASTGCATCHVPDIGGVKGVYSDFLLYSLEEPLPNGGAYGPEPPVENARPSWVPRPDEWRTPPLWGVADSAPYLHDGSASNLQQAIVRHRRDGKVAGDRYAKLPASEQAALLAFLGTLKAPPDAIPAAQSVNRKKRLAKNG